MANPAAEVPPFDFDKIMADMKQNQAESMDQTRQMKEAQNAFDVQMQGIKVEANAKKAFNDALKATANVKINQRGQTRLILLL